MYEYRDRIRHVLTAHEQGAAHAADGYARSTGKAGVVIATSGPGATNLVTGIATAYMDSIPMAVSYTHLDVYKRQPGGCRTLITGSITIRLCTTFWRRFGSRYSNGLA